MSKRITAVEKAKRALIRCTRKLWSRIDQSAGKDSCWPWLGRLDQDGYGRLDWCGHAQTLAHRHVFRLTFNIEPIVVCHHCDNRKCCNPTHLYNGTLQTNIADRTVRNRGYKGPAYWNRKVTEVQAREILNSTEFQYMIAKQYGISQAAVSFIKSRKNWKCL